MAIINPPVTTGPGVSRLQPGAAVLQGVPRAAGARASAA